MDLSLVLYGLIAGCVFAAVARAVGLRATPAQRVQSAAWIMLAFALLIVLQLGGYGATFSVVSLAAALFLTAYLAARRIVLRPR